MFGNIYSQKASQNNTIYVKSYNNILEAALLTFSIEIETLQQIRDSLGNTFVKVVECLSVTKGRVVVTGLGKSAIIARKIVASFNSTGTHSIFMHAGDALHGDLGMLGGDDVLLCISKSGETAELKVLLPLVKGFGNKIIGMTSEAGSFLATYSDYLLHIPITEEADPNNLAPTSSSTAQMVMGDALAVCLLAQKGFTSDDFSKFHPAGSLGKQLYLRVDDLYVKNSSPSVKEMDDLKKIIVSMTTGRLGITVVVNDQNEPIGVITDGDLRRMLEKNLDRMDNVYAVDIMSSSPVRIAKTEMAVDALAIMKENSITQVVVIDKGEYVGIVHLHDLLQEGIV